MRAMTATTTEKTTTTTTTTTTTEAIDQVGEGDINSALRRVRKHAIIIIGKADRVEGIVFSSERRGKKTILRINVIRFQEQ